MNWRRNSPSRLNLFLSWLVLAVLLLYTYQELFHAPYLGFNFNPSTGQVQKIYVNHLAADLHVNDELYAVGALLLADWKDDLHQPLFEDVKPGQFLPLKILRAGQIEHVEWQVAGFNRDEFLSRLFNNWWVGYVFWLAGTATLLLLRPRNTLYWLLATFFLLTAIWLVVGNTSRWNLWQSAIIYRIAIWLLVPVILHLHWLFPHPFAKVSRPLLWIAYLAAIIASVLQWFELIPTSAAVLALGLAFMGSFCLLFAHLIRQPKQRNQVKFLLWAFGFTFLPLLGLGIAALFNAIPSSGPVVLLALPVIPTAYFFSVYRYQLGALELRANRLIALYLFLIVLSTGIIVFTAILSGLSEFPGESIFVNLTIGLLSALIGVVAFPSFTRFVEHRLLAIPLPPVSLLETYLERITTSLTKFELVQLIREKILPSLLIRQSVLLYLRNRQELVYSEGVAKPDLLALPDLRAFFGDIEIYHPTTPSALEQSKYPWMYLGLPLRFEGELIGAWLFGRHDPDDLYSQGEITVLQTLAHQTSIALVNIEQSELLKALYQRDIDHSEAERTRLAHTLHDEILNQIGLIYTSLDAACLSDNFVELYQSVKGQLRQMITDLRPATLDFGLYRAFEEYVAYLEERHGHTIMVLLDIATSDLQIRYPLRVEEHVFRIVQQACENSLRHAQPALIGIQGAMSPNSIDIMVEDDGVGFPLDDPLHLSQLFADLLANKHFGLVGMYERAAMIQAKVLIDSVPNQGTRVRVVWADDPSAVSSHIISKEQH